MKVSGIYTITNTQNGKFYLGSSVNTIRRWSIHRLDLKRGTHHSAYLQNAWNKYGSDAWEWEVLCECAEEDLEYWENYFLASWKPYQENVGYNIARFADAPMRGRFGKENPNYGKRCSAETKAKIAAAQKGEKGNWYGRKHSAKSRAKMSEVAKGHEVTKSTREKMRLAKNPDLFEYKGETLTLSEWSTRFGINRTTLGSRLRESGWSIERALTEPAATNKDRAEQHIYKGEKHSLRGWSETTGIAQSTLDARVNKLGWDIKRALETPVSSRQEGRLIQHNGEVHNIKEWATIKNIAYSVLVMRLNRGWSAKRALETPVRPIRNSQPVGKNNASN